MSSVFAIAGHELRRLFVSPLAWFTLAAVELLLAIFFFVLVYQFLNAPGVAEIGVTNFVGAGLLQVTGILLLLVTPFLTMRLFSEEYRSGSLKLLLSSPVTLTQIVLGKYLGIYAFLLIMLAIIAAMPLSLAIGTTLDFGQLGAGLLGLALLMAAFAAIGLFISTLTAQPAVAAITTFAVLFILWILNLAASSATEHVAAVLSYLSLLQHYNALLKGVFNSVDVVFYVLLALLFLILTIWRLDGERLHG